MSEEETQPLITVSEQRKHDFRPVYYYFIITFVGCLGTALISQATTDAEYYVICKYAGIDADVCLRDPRTSDYESILSSYVDVIGGISQTVSLFFISHFVNVCGMRPVVIGTCIFSMLHALGFWFLLEVPYVHYLWAIVPEMFLRWSFFELSQVLSGIYISEQIHDATYRTLFLGWMDAVLSGPQIVGPSIGGIVLAWWGLSNLFIVSAVFGLVGIITALLFLQESHKVEPDTGEVEPQSSIFDCVRLVGLNYIEDPVRRLSGRKVELFLVGIIVLSNVSDKLQPIYVKKRFGWSAIENGYLSSIKQANRTVMLTIVSPLVITALSNRFGRHDNDYDKVDSLMVRFTLLWSIGCDMLRALLPYPKAYYAIECLSRGGTVSQSTLLSLVFKYAPEGKTTSFWIGYLYVVEMAVIPSVLLALNLYRLVLRTLPESIFWALAVGATGILLFASSIKMKS